MNTSSPHAEAPRLVVSDGRGRIFEVPELLMAGMTLSAPCLPEPEDLIPLPAGSSLYMLPSRKPVGLDPATGEFVTLNEYRGAPVFAAAAFLTPGHVQILRSAYRTQAGAPRLPLFSYTALGWRRGRFYAAGIRLDRDVRHDPARMDRARIERRAGAMLRRYPRNRLVRHLVENCVRRYRCPSAQNFVLGRWECPVAVAAACNARCLGCISGQPAGAGIAPPQDRITFVPTVDEIVEYTVPHLEHAARPMVSFGQGCEGEPLLQEELVREAVREIRRRTRRGILNMNTNGSRPDAIERLCAAGLDSIRVSMNSARAAYYDAFYRPRGYAFSDVARSIQVMRARGKWASLNYLMFPGFTDTRPEQAALHAFVRATRPSMLQARSLNIDPEWYIAELRLASPPHKPLGTRLWLARLRAAFPQLRIGCFNPSAFAAR